MTAGTAGKTRSAKKMDTTKTETPELDAEGRRCLMALVGAAVRIGEARMQKQEEARRAALLAAAERRHQEGRARTAAFAEKWSLQLRLTPDSSGYRGDDDEGTPYRVELTVLDPVSRLHRTATGWTWATADDEEDGAGRGWPECPVPADEVFFQALGGLWFDCDELSHGRDLFDFCLEHHEGTAGSAAMAREQYRWSCFHRDELQRLFGPAGYQEFLDLDPYGRLRKLSAPRKKESSDTPA